MLDNKIVNQVVSALLNQNGGSKTLSKLYGTVEVVDGKKYVKLDGSDTLTAIVEGTEVMAGDRVLVSIENHQAVVISNITSPASARTATRFMDFSEEDGGLVIGELEDDDNDFNILIKPDGVYIRDGESILSKYTSEGIDFGTWIGSDEHSYAARLREGALELYRGFGGYDDYEAMLRLHPGHIEGENSFGQRFEILANQIQLEGLYHSNMTGIHGLGDCVVPAVYTSSGTAIYFTIPLPVHLNTRVTKITCNCTVRCGGYYLIQESSSGGTSCYMETGVVNHPYVYNGSSNVQKNASFTIDSVSHIGINCRITFTGESSISNGLNNNAAVAMLYGVEITCAV